MNRLILFASLIVASCSGKVQKEAVAENKQFDLLWQNKEFDWVITSITIKDSTVFFGSFNGSLNRASLGSGDFKTVHQTGEAVYYQPVLDSNSIFFTSFDLGIYSIDTLGKLLWRVPTTDRVKNPLENDGNSVIVSIRGNGIRKLQKEDGNTLWHLPQSSESFTTTKPIIQGNAVYVGNFNDKIVAIDKQVGKVIWEKSQEGSATSDPVPIEKGLIVSQDRYYKGGSVRMLDYKTGNEQWSTPSKVEAHYKPYADNSRVIFGTYDNKIVSLDSNDGRITWQFNLLPDEVALTSPVYFKGNIYFGTSLFHLYSLNAETGKVVFRERFDYGISEPIVYGSNLYVPTGGGAMWKLKNY